ncbi:hypothetical protein SDC9_54715 [bioreactor metagenome]|uniref:Helix-turn-helix domain-containing protein n=1 Tax=bioreactor metagenome TaxID=1076179 RepID=A0A644X285_9ZZZZ
MTDISLDNINNILTVEDARKELKVGRTTMYKLIVDNKIKHFHIGKAIRIPKSSLIEFVQSSCYNVEATR